MVRYIKNDELYHHGTLGMKWGRRLYQYPDGTLTPLGREHYGYKGTKDTRDPTDRRIAKVTAFGKTLEGYVKRSYKYAPVKKVNKPTVADKFAKAREAKAEKKKEEEAKKLEEKAKVEKEQSESKARTDQAKQNRWSEFTDEELKRYASRVELEAKATEALLKKIDAPRLIIEKIASYGKTGYDAYKTYSSIMDMVETNRKKKVAANKPADPTNRIAEDYMKKFMKEYDVRKNNMTDKDLEKFKADLYKNIQFLEASRTLYKISQGVDTGNSSGKQKDKNK